MIVFPSLNSAAYQGADSDKLKAYLSRVDEITKEEIESATTESAPTVDPSVDKNYVPPLGEALEANPKVFFDVAIAGTEIGRIVIELKADVAPKYGHA